MSVQESNVAVLRKWFGGGVWGCDSHEKADAFIDAHYAADGKAYGIGGKFVEGPEAFKKFRRAMATAFPTQNFEITHLHAHDNMVWIRWEATLLTPKKKEYCLVGGGPMEMVDGQITKAWNLVNFLDLLEAADKVDAVGEDTLVNAFAAFALE